MNAGNSSSEMYRAFAHDASAAARFDSLPLLHQNLYQTLKMTTMPRAHAKSFAAEVVVSPGRVA